MNWYKATGPGGSAMFGTGIWNLPTDDGPGEWMPRLEGQIIPCVYGYHVTDAAHVLNWVGPEMYLAEVDPCGVLIPDSLGDKWATPKARLMKRLPWDEQAALQFIEDCDLHTDGDGYQSMYKADARHAVTTHQGDWAYLDKFLWCCRAYGATNREKERLWQNQRLLMYIHGGIA